MGNNCASPASPAPFPFKCRISAGMNLCPDHLQGGSVLLVASVPHRPKGRNLDPSLWEKAGIWFPFFPHEQDSQIKEENVFEQQPKLHTIRGKAKCLAQSCPAVLGLWSSSHLLLLFLSLIPPYLCTSFCPSCVKVELIWLSILPSKPIFSVGYWVQCENAENGVCKAGKNDRVSSCLFSSGWNCHL